MGFRRLQCRPLRCGKGWLLFLRCGLFSRRPRLCCFGMVMMMPVVVMGVMMVVVMMGEIHARRGSAGIRKPANAEDSGQ